MAETQGRGHGVIPVYTLLGGRKATEVDAVTEEEEEQKEGGFPVPFLRKGGGGGGKCFLKPATKLLRAITSVGCNG